MGIDLSRFKVVYGDKVLHALALQNITFKDNQNYDDQYKKPIFIEVVVINEDGNILCIHDESWMFQFIPIVNK